MSETLRSSLPLAGAANDGTMRSEIAERFESLLAREGAALARVAASYEREASRREDLLQDICVAIWQALPRFRGEASERTFVFRIAHNRGLSALARRPAAATALEEASDLVDPALDPESAAAGRQRSQRLLAAMQTLPLGLRQVLSLTLEGLSQREIAEVLGISENNVAVRVTRGRQALRRALGEEIRR